MEAEQAQTEPKAVETVKVQFSKDGTMYHVPAMASKLAWLSVQSYESPEAIPMALLMPFSAACRYERATGAYVRMWWNAAWMPVVAGEVKDLVVDSPLVADFRDAQVMPVASKAPAKPSLKVIRRKGKQGQL